MWIKQSELVFIKGELERAQNDLFKLGVRYKKLLDRLELAEWEEPAQLAEIKIITKEEYLKKLEVKNSDYSNYLRTLAEAQQNMFNQRR